MKVRTKFSIIAFVSIFVFVVGYTALFCSIVNAADTATIEIAWVMSVEDQADIDGFVIYDDVHAVQLDNIPADARSGSFEIEAAERSWYMKSFVDTSDGRIYSDPSNIVTWTPPPPEQPVLPVPVTLQISGTINVVPQ